MPVANDLISRNRQPFTPGKSDSVGVWSARRRNTIRYGRSGRTLANDTPFGLAGAVWTQNVARAHRLASQVRAGTFWINGYKTISVMSPFGGFGKSRSSGKDALMAYTQTKSIWVETAAEPGVAFGYVG